MQAGQPVGPNLSPDQLIQLQRELVSGQLQPAPLGTVGPRTRGTPLMTENDNNVRVDLRARGSTTPGQFESGQGIYVPDAGAYYPDQEHYQEQRPPPEPAITRPTSVNRQMGMALTDPNATPNLSRQVQANVALRDIVEPGRIPSMMAANRVGRGLVAVSMASEQEITTGRMAGGATHNSAAAAMRDFHGRTPVNRSGPIPAADLDDATRVRRGSLGVVFLRLREALRQGGGRAMLKEAGGAPLARLAAAFSTWLNAAMPPAGGAPLPEAQVTRLADTLRRRLVEFLHAQTEQGGQ